MRATIMTNGFLPSTQPARRFGAIFAVLLIVMLGARPAAAIDQAMPGQGDQVHGMTQMDQQKLEENARHFAMQDRRSFDAGIKLDDWRKIPIMHDDTVKILDSWARQNLYQIAHSQSLDGQDALLVVMDMATRPEYWFKKNIIYIQAVPIRQALAEFARSQEDAKRLIKEGTVSPEFLMSPDIRQAMDLLARDSTKSKSVNEIMQGLQAFWDLGSVEAGLSIVPPPPGSATWHNPMEFMAEPPAEVPAPSATTAPASAPAMHFPDGYSRDQALRIQIGFAQLVSGWRENDVTVANAGIDQLRTVVDTINPDAVPSHAKRVAELWYNRTFHGTILDVFLYFISLVLFVMVAVGVTQRLEKTATIIFAIALVIHLAAMGVRWWIAGRIPIQNQFESVLGSAAIGCTLGLILERWKKNGIFGMAFSFVGFMAMTACFAAPYVFGKDLGGTISQVAGILGKTYWLYIHVNIVIGSYALIAASAMIAGLYLFMKQWYWVNPLEEDESGNGGVNSQGSGVAVAAMSATEVKEIGLRRARFLDTLDQANMVILQMAFWLLGTGIICGAIWADVSWGRPWGWDPKETFALVTWIVYLIIVHVRLVVQTKADTTAWLTLAGFGVMMFNWIGVNFFLVGLHSYA